MTLGCVMPIGVLDDILITSLNPYFNCSIACFILNFNFNGKIKFKWAYITKNISQISIISSSPSFFCLKRLEDDRLIFTFLLRNILLIRDVMLTTKDPQRAVGKELT